MRKGFLELQYLEEQKLRNEIKKIENAEQYYKLLSIFKALAIIFFIMNLVVIITAGIYEFMIVDINSLLVNFLVIIFSITSLILLLISIFYKNKTLDSLDRYYNEQV